MIPSICSTFLLSTLDLSQSRKFSSEAEAGKFVESFTREHRLPDCTSFSVDEYGTLSIVWASPETTNQFEIIYPSLSNSGNGFDTKIQAITVRIGSSGVSCEAILFRQETFDLWSRFVRQIDPQNILSR